MAQLRCDRLLDNVLAGLGERGDVLWQLASTGDLEGLRAAAHRVEDWSRYAQHRARAFALALEGLGTAALDELNWGWDGAWPPVSVYATDAAQIHFLAGDPDRALATLALGVRGAQRLPVGARVLLAGCVRARRSLWRTAVRIAASAGTNRDQARALAAVVIAALGRSR